MADTQIVPHATAMVNRAHVNPTGSDGAETDRIRKLLFRGQKRCLHVRLPCGRRCPRNANAKTAARANCAAVTALIKTAPPTPPGTH
eukprot:8845847-Lingulodinium_polyedra.AAC.1